MAIQKLHSYFSKFVLKLERVEGKKPNAKDIIRSGFLCAKDYVVFGSSISDYFELGFYHMDADEKKEYLTCRFYHKFIHRFDSDEYVWEYNKKSYQYDCLKQFMGREQLFSSECSQESFCSFVERHPVFLLKPDENDCGEGIERIDSTDHDLQELYSHVTRESAVIDELIIQHPSLENFAPGSVNTLRIVTAKIGDTVTIVGAALRVGSGISTVDNFSAGGFVGAVDLETGSIVGDGENHTGKRFKCHPYSGVVFKGFQIPNWDKVLKLVQECAKKYKVNFVGWDVAVRKDDAIIVEANIMPMIHVFQIAGNGGKKFVFQELYRKKIAYDRQILQK